MSSMPSLSSSTSSSRTTTTIKEEGVKALKEIVEWLNETKSRSQRPIINHETDQFFKKAITLSNAIKNNCAVGGLQNQISQLNLVEHKGTNIDEEELIEQINFAAIYDEIVEGSQFNGDYVDQGSSISASSIEMIEGSLKVLKQLWHPDKLTSFIETCKQKEDFYMIASAFVIIKVYIEWFHHTFPVFPNIDMINICAMCNATHNEHDATSCKQNKNYILRDTRMRNITNNYLTMFDNYFRGQSHQSNADLYKAINFIADYIEWSKPLNRVHYVDIHDQLVEWLQSHGME